MAKSLKFKLGISIIEAKKEVKKFVADANKSMQGLKTDIKLNTQQAKTQTEKLEEIRKNSLAKIERMEITAGSASIAKRQEYVNKLQKIMEGANERTLASTRRMVRGAEAEYAKWNRMAIKQITDEQRAREKAANAAREMQGPHLDPEIVKRQEAANKAREDSITKMQNFEIRSGQVSLEHRKKYLDELNRITATSHKRSVDGTKRLISTLETEYQKNTTNVIQQQKAIQTAEGKILKQREIQSKKDQTEAKNRAESIERMRKESLSSIERAEIRAGASHIQARRRYMTQLENIIQTSNDRSLADTKEMIRMIEAEYAKINRMELAGARAGGGYVDISDRTRNLSRQTNILFNVQQAIEDFSFAGMRGASNNLAAMAAMIGGPAGIVAMLGLAGYSLYNIGKQMGWFGEKVEETTKSIANQIQTLKELRDAARQRELGFSGRGFGNSRSQMFERAKDVELFRRELASLNSDAKRFAAIDEELRGFLAPMRDPRTTPIKGGMGGAALDEARLKEVEKFYAKRDRAVEFLKENRDIFGDVDVDTFYESYKENLELIQEFRQEAEKNEKLKQKEIEDTKKQINVLKDYLSVEREIERLEKKMKSGLSGISGLDDLPLAKKALKDAQEGEQNRIDAIEEEVAKRKEVISLLQAQGREKESVEKAKQLADYLVDQTESLKGLNQEKRRFLELTSAAYKVSKDVVQDAEKLAANTERAAKAAWKRVDALNAEKKSNQYGFESSVFSAQNTILNKQAEEALETRKNMLGTSESYLKRDEFMIKFMFGDNDRTKALIDKRAKIIAKQYEYALKSIEATVEGQRRTREKKLLNNRIEVLEGRSKSQSKVENFKGSIESLSEVQSLLLGAMGNAASSSQMTMYLNRAKKVQEEIDKMHDKNIKREREKANEASKLAKQSADLLEEAVRTKEAIETLDPNKNGAIDKLLQMQKILEKMKFDAESLEGVFKTQQDSVTSMNSPLPNFMAANMPKGGAGGVVNNTTINVGSLNTGVANANALGADINAKAKRQGIMMS